MSLNLRFLPQVFDQKSAFLSIVLLFYFKLYTFYIEKKIG